MMNTDSGDREHGFRQAERSSVAERSLGLSLLTERTPKDGSLEATDEKTSRRSPPQIRDPASAAGHCAGLRARAGHGQHLLAASHRRWTHVAAAGRSGRCRPGSAALYPTDPAFDER